MQFLSRLACSCLLVVSVLSAGAAQTTEPATKPSMDSGAFPAAGHGDLRLSIPPGWKQTVEKPPRADLPDTVSFKDDSGKFELLMSIIPRQPGAPADFNSSPKLRTIAQLQGAQMLQSAREKSLDLEEIKGAAATGFVYTLTDKAPAPGSYEYVTGGVVGVGDLMLSVTLLMHDKFIPQRKLALDMLASAAQDAVAPSNLVPTTVVTPAPTTAPSASTQNASGESRLSIALPNKNWQLTLDHPELKVVQDQTSADKHARHLMAVDPQSGLHLSIFLEPAAVMGDAKVVRQFYFDKLKSSPVLMREDKFSDGPENSARADYLVPDVDQRNTNIYLSREGVWIDVHLSIEDVKNEKSQMIEDIVKSIRLEPRAKQ